MTPVLHETTRRRTGWLLAGGLSAAAGGYVFYRILLKKDKFGCTSPIMGAAANLWKLLNVMGAAADLSSTAMKDLQAFLVSDSDEVPQTLRQVLKLARTSEFQQAVMLSSQHVAHGIARSLDVKDPSRGRTGRRSSKGVIEVVLEELFTEQGKSFVSTVCARVVKTLVTSQQSALLSAETQGNSSLSLALVNAFASERGKELAAVIVKTFAVNCVGVFLDKTQGVNMYSDIVAGIATNPEVVKDVCSHVAVTTAKEVIRDVRKRRRRRRAADAAPLSSSSPFATSPSAERLQLQLPRTDSDSELHPPWRGSRNVAFAAEVGQCLAQPEIRQLALEVTGVVTTRSVEAFILVFLQQIFGRPKAPGD